MIYITITLKQTPPPTSMEKTTSLLSYQSEGTTAMLVAEKLVSTQNIDIRSIKAATLKDRSLLFNSSYKDSLGMGMAGTTAIKREAIEKKNDKLLDTKYTCTRSRLIPI